MLQNAYFGAGCFWGVEDKFQSLDGVLEAISGYAGGETLNPNYKSVCTGETGHAEVVKVIYENEKISFLNLLEFFFSIHDCSLLNRQGPDIGTNYRSIVFYSNGNEKKLIDQKIQALKDEGEIVATDVQEFKRFYEAEDYHQDYYLKNKL